MSANLLMNMTEAKKSANRYSKNTAEFYSAVFYKLFIYFSHSIDNEIDTIHSIPS